MVNRSSLPIPTVTVLAPSLTEIRLRRGASNALRYQTLEGSSSLPDCLEKAKQEVFFSWRNTAAQATAALTSTDPGALRLLEVDLATSSQRSLQVYPEQMTAGVRYTFELTGCLGFAFSALCGTDTAEVILMDSPLRVAIAGGDFATSTTGGFTIDACESGDPDEPDAELEWAWRGPYAVLADGELAVNATIAPPHRNQSGCSWEIEAGVLPAGEYVFVVNGSLLVAGVAGGDGELASAEDTVRVTLLEALTRPTLDSRPALHTLLTLLTLPTLLTRRPLAPHRAPCSTPWRSRRSKATSSTLGRASASSVSSARVHPST